MTEHDDDQLDFVDEPDTSGTAESPWHILIVDDDPDVHSSTALAMRGVQVEQRLCDFTSAYSAAEALALLRQRSDFAVALIDVVMEADDSGLRLVQAIREELQLREMRIILRTGQPGYAPEMDTIQRFDINDYRTKLELTRVRLFTSVSLAIRTYAQLQQLNISRQGLEQILAATAELGRPEGLSKFAAGLVTQLCALLNVETECLVCAVLEPGQEEPTVLAAAGRYQSMIGEPLNAIAQPEVRLQLLKSLHERQHHFDHGACLYVPGKDQQSLAAYVELDRSLSDIECHLLQVFCSNLSVAFENLQLYLKINDLAFFDGLVHLPNRNGLLLSLAERQPDDAHLALIDLDGFADINSIIDDSYGDQVLQLVAQRLRSAFSADTLVARIGSDVFALHGPNKEVNPTQISSLFSQPLDTADGEPLRISATSGLLALDSASSSPAEQLKDAGAALKEAKFFHRGAVHWHQPGLAEAARDRLRLLSSLRTAFSQERLKLHYQPLVDLGSQRIVGAEALLRWQTDSGEFVPPDRFIPLAEQSGLMVALGHWVMCTALRWRASLVDQVDPEFRIAINVSQVQFAEPDFVNMVKQAVQQAGLVGTQVEIELTESVAMTHISELEAKLTQLRATGIGIALDDFGTGYSSLSVLQHLTLSRLKIDRSFISGQGKDGEPLGLAKMVLAIARQLSLKVIAEGIEAAEQRDGLLQAGCGEGQGYLFSPPVSEQDFAALLESPKNTE